MSVGYQIMIAHKPEQDPDPNVPPQPWTLYSLELGDETPEAEVQATLAALSAVPYWNEVSLTRATSTYTREVWNPATQEYEVQE